MKWYADGNMPRNKYINVDISFGSFICQCQHADMQIDQCKYFIWKICYQYGILYADADMVTK